jgi:hypothetical protein
MARLCRNENEACPIKESRRKSIYHHLFYYANMYETPLEKAFRGLPENLLERCVCIEQADPHLNPLQKPTIQEMCVALMVQFDGS